MVPKQGTQRQGNYLLSSSGWIWIKTLLFMRLDGESGNSSDISLESLIMISPTSQRKPIAAEVEEADQLGTSSLRP